MLPHAYRPSNRARLLAAVAFGAASFASPVLAQGAPVASAPPSPAATVLQPDSTTQNADTNARVGAPAAPVNGPVTASQPVAAPTDTAGGAGEIIVTGIRKSLQSATIAKQSSVAFGDSIFAEDIGKLPATNLAETLNRIPGVNISRDIDGEGVQVSIRGLGPSFVKVLLNGNNIGVASDGGTNGGGPTRAVDLDLFPSELFTRLDVLKTPVASTLEGGIAGTVNLRNARPFDRPGEHITVVGQADGHDTNSKFGPRGAVVASKTFGDTFGVLLGFAGYTQKERIDGFEFDRLDRREPGLRHRLQQQRAGRQRLQLRDDRAQQHRPRPDAGHARQPRADVGPVVAAAHARSDSPPWPGQHHRRHALAHLGAGVVRMAAQRRAAFRTRRSLRRVEARL